MVSHIAFNMQSDTHLRGQPANETPFLLDAEWLCKSISKDNDSRISAWAASLAMSVEEVMPYLWRALIHDVGMASVFQPVG